MSYTDKLNKFLLLSEQQEQQQEEDPVEEYKRKKREESEKQMKFNAAKGAAKTGLAAATDPVIRNKYAQLASTIGSAGLEAGGRLAASVAKPIGGYLKSKLGGLFNKKEQPKDKNELQKHIALRKERLAKRAAMQKTIAKHTKQNVQKAMERRVASRKKFGGAKAQSDAAKAGKAGKYRVSHNPLDPKQYQIQAHTIHYGSVLVEAYSKAFNTYIF